MRPTIRAWSVVVVVVAAVAMSWQYGPRSLNAVVTPLLVVLGVAIVSMALVDRPVVDRHPIEPGFPGDRRTVAITVTTDSAITATVRDTVGSGLETDTKPAVETTLEGESRLEYEIDLRDRGEQTVGPLSITVTDVFGLVSRRFEYEATTDVLVYPRIYAIDGDLAGDVRALVESTGETRDEFDHLRAYQPGDPRRAVHWKASAKQPDDDLVVAERDATDTADSVTIAAAGSPDDEDTLASAIATVATVLTEVNVPVALETTAWESTPPDATNHRDLLAALAVTNGSDLESQHPERADVVVRVDGTKPTVVVGDRTLQFEQRHAATVQTDSGQAVDAICDGGDRQSEVRS